LKKESYQEGGEGNSLRFAPIRRKGQFSRTKTWKKEGEGSIEK